MLQAPRAWFDRLRHTLHTFGFSGAKSDQSLFIRVTPFHTTFILVYVDDILLLGSSNTKIDVLVAELHANFSLKDLGAAKYFLGIELIKTPTGIMLSQRKYLIDILHRAKMEHANPLPTPMTPGDKLSAQGDEIIDEVTLYRSLVGALQYATITRPELSYVVNKVSQYMLAPLLSHFKALKKILRYIRGTLDYGLSFHSTTT